MIAACFEIFTVGLPFCAFKLIAGIALSQYWLTAWGIIDTFINLGNFFSLAISRKRFTDVCLLSLAFRLVRRPDSAQLTRWLDLGAATDMFLSFAIVAFMLGGGFLPGLPRLHLQVWNISVILNVLGAGSVRLSQSLSGLRKK